MYNYEQIKSQYYFNNKKYSLIELKYDSKTIHNVMSYGENNHHGKYIANLDLLKYLALNPDKNILEKNVYNNNKNIFEKKSLPLCFVEYKTKYYKMVFDFDFKYEKYPEIYKGYLDQHDIITKYIVEKIIISINNTLNKPNIQYIWSEKNNSFGYHIYFPNIICDKLLHKYIFDFTIKQIEEEKVYPPKLISQIFDDCVGNGNGVRLWYYKIYGDYYYPVKEKSTFVFDSEPSKHFKYCLLNTNFQNYNNELKISMDLLEDNNKIINHKQKKSDLEKNIIKSDIEYIEDYKTLNIDDKKELFVGLVNLLPISLIDDYKTWIKLVYLYKNYNIDQNEIIKLSSKSKKYDGKSEQMIIDIYSNKKIKKNVRIISLGTLVKWAKESNLIETNRLFAKYYLTTKLNVKNIDEILLSRLNIKPNFKEESKYISDKAYDIFKYEISHGIECLVLKSPTGTGKTTIMNKLINYLIETDPELKIISIITRRSMSSCHINAFNSPDNKINFTSYLDDDYESLDYFISSLENLTKINETYEIVILDEINSLINYFYSSTLANKRLQCISSLIKIISNAKYIISVDANITDMVFSLFTQLNKKIFYYENTFKNKVDIPLNLFYCVQYKEDNNLNTWCNKYIIPNYILKSKSCLILSDSKEITDKLKLIFIKSNPNEDYYRIFNREEGTLDDLTNINKIGTNRCVCCSPKIIYGLDITIEYDEIFIIYKRNSGLDSMGALEMCQQMARARNTKAVNLLLLDPSSQFTFNQFIDFETNKNLQESWINGYIDFHDNLCKKYNVINEMGCTHLDIDGTIKFNINSFMTQIHYLKTWYDQLFYRNKADIIKLIAKDYGYKINESKWNPEYLFGLESLKEKLNLKKEEILNISKKIYKGEKIDKKYDKYIDNLKEQIKMREKYLKNINDVKLKENLSCDSEKFKEWLYMKYLNLSKDEFNKKTIEINNSDIVQMVKDDDLINKINTCFWLEELIGFSRFDIDKIKYDNIDGIKKILLKNTEKLYVIYKNNNCANKTIKSIKYKINSIINENYLQKFVAEVYNNVIDELFTIESKQYKINKKLVRIYTIKIN
jgi:hypothetical protein